jgi:SAM-dependent methyltransferase
VTDWRSYVDSFHDARPGITEELLVRCHDPAGITPYEWLVDAVPDGRGLVVELACGSSPLHPLLTRRAVLSIDRSRSELLLARARGAQVARADAAALPLPDASASVVVCSMALMLMAPLDRALAEIARVLQPDGTLAAIVPSSGPLSARDLWTYGRLLRALRTRGLGYPDAIENAGPRLAAAGLALRADTRRRFAFTAASSADADLFLRSLYLPGVNGSALHDGRALMRKAADGSGRQLGVPIRRLVAVRC